MNGTGVKTSDVMNILNPNVNESGSDTDLVCKCLLGDIGAFEILYKKYQTPVFNIANRMVGGEDAYDLTQDIFFCALKSLKTFRGDAKFSTWLFSIAKNACLNRIRASKRLKEDSIEFLAEEQPNKELADETVNIEQSAEINELNDIVHTVLLKMNPDQRIIIVLRDFEQLSYEEIGDVLGISLQTVKSRLHRARIAFKNKFSPYYKSYNNF